jgi:N-acetylneuraminic acid mutarotase
MMKTTLQLMLVMLLSIGVASFAQEQAPSVTHNTWSSGTPMPTPVWLPAGGGVLKNEIYVVGGVDASGTTVDTVQIYNPSSKSWRTGAPLPVATGQSGAGVALKNILYIFGGSGDAVTCTTPSNAVWAYNVKTKAWSAKASMPTARCAAEAAVANNIIYVIGGYANGNSLTTVESYNPATDSWKEEAPLLNVKNEPSVGVVGTKNAGYTVLASGGYLGNGFTGDTEAYNAGTNTWTTLNPDPTPRNGACSGAIGTRFFVAAGSPNGTTATESFTLSKNVWKTLAPTPQQAMFGVSAVYKGQLYCIGGANEWMGTVLNNVQIYQP